MSLLIDIATLSALWFVGVVVKKSFELILEREYPVWAGALARLLVRVAGFVYRQEREHWWADLLYVQMVEGESGLFQAGSCLVTAPWHALRSAARSVCLRALTFYRMDVRMDAKFAWAAGLFEGEGTVELYRRKGRSDPGRRLKIVMTDKDVVAEFAKVLGCGECHPMALQPQNVQPLWRWRVGSMTDISAVYRHIGPWLGTRRRARFEDTISDPSWGNSACISRRVPRPDSAPTAFPNASPECEWAWAAGLFEAEGWFGTSNQGRTGRLVLATVDADTVQRFRAIVQCGYIAPVQRPNKQPCFYWSLNYSDDICELIPKLLPWLGDRRAAAAERTFEVAMNVPGNYSARRGPRRRGQN